MHRNHLLKILLYCFAFYYANLTASSIIPGPTSVYLQNDHLVLYDTEKVQGFVRLNNGFTIANSGMATLDTFITVSGAIDLRDTGQLQLLSDLSLDSGVTLSSGGKIRGHGRSIILNGNLTIPANKTLHITSNTIIEGNGNTLLVDENAQLLVDTAVTLTLKNLVLKNTRNALASPAIQLAASTSQLALDNIIFAPTGDFLFPQGQLFVHHDVLFTGTSAFIYQSTQPSHITPHACLGFDLETTFSFVPASTSKDLIVMDDQSSTLYLNGCTLVATATGLRLTTGRLLIDNQVTLDTGITFSYAPIIANRDMLSMVDETSRLYLHGCTLQSTTTGMRLTKGTLFVDYINNLENDNALNISEGFCLGDGQAGNDVMVEVMAGGSLNVISGILDYQNIGMID